MGCTCRQKFVVRRAKKKPGRKSKKSFDYNIKTELPDPKTWKKNNRKLRTKEDISK